jgi:hypothetical protein
MQNKIPNYPTFFLRSDFAVEIGFLDTARAPMTASAFAQRCAREKRQFSYEGLARVNAERAIYPLRRYYIYTGAVLPGQLKSVPLVSDGHRWYPVPQEVFSRTCCVGCASRMVPLRKRDRGLSSAI